MTRSDDPRKEVTPETCAPGDPLLERLPQRSRVALMLRDRAGLSDQAIATHLRVGVAEVPGIIDEARGELRRLRQGEKKVHCPIPPPTYDNGTRHHGFRPGPFGPGAWQGGSSRRRHQQGVGA